MYKIKSSINIPRVH